MSTHQNIVIIGAQGAGASLTNALVPEIPGTHRILLIDALPFSHWPISSLRASVVPGWENRTTAPLDTESFFSAGSGHEVIPGNKVVELRKDSVVLEKPFEGSTEVPFFRCIIATGAAQPLPMKPQPGMTQEEYVAALKKMQGEFQKARKVVIVGAGPVGTEISADIKINAGPKDSVTLVHSAPHVLNPDAKKPGVDKFSYSSPPTALKLSVALESQLKQLGIELITNDQVVIPSSTANLDPGEWDGKPGLQDGVKKVKLKSGKTLEADYVFVGIGNKPNVELVQKADPGALVAGLVGVDEYLKVISKTPNSPLTDGYYAIGDCCSSPGWKTMQGAISDGEGCAKNILADIKGKPRKSYTRPKPYAMFVPLTKNGGAGTLDLPWIGDWMTPGFMVRQFKGQKLFVEELFLPRFKGPKKPTLPAVPA